MIEVFKKENQAYGEFNNGEIIENKPIGFPADRGPLVLIQFILLGSCYSKIRQYYWSSSSQRL